MPDQDERYDDATEKWPLIATAAEDNGFLRGIVQLGVEMHADVTVNLRIPGDDRYLSVSFGHAGEDEEDADGE